VENKPSAAQLEFSLSTFHSQPAFLMCVLRIHRMILFCVYDQKDCLRMSNKSKLRRTFFSR